MPSSAPPPNPCLLAILLVVQSRSGPRLVFHYPPEPLSNKQSHAQKKGGASTDVVSNSSSASDTGAPSTDDEVTSERQAKDTGSKKDQIPRQARGVGSHLTDEESDEVATPEDSYGQAREWQPAWEPLFSLEGLVTLLTPSNRMWHKRKFEFTINALTFLGWPVFIREDGTWQKRRTKTNKRNDIEDIEPGDTSQDTANESNTEGEKNDESAKKPERGTSASSELLMFNVLVVVNPSALEHNLRIKEMYDNVVKKLGRALKWEQARQNYVWTESELMLSIKTKHEAKRSPTAAVYAELLSRSSLAQAISSVYNAISCSRIASITLSPDTSTSFQIPPITSTPTLPSLIDHPNQPGVWLTTANEPSSSPTDVDNTLPDSSHLAKHFTLLLNSPPSQILKDIASTPSPISGPLTTLIQNLNPTKSFYKISLASSIPLADMQTLARHLVYWRRAIAIPPLHQRDTYIVSPNADLSKLSAACDAYAQQFPTLPGLANMLAALSGTPRQWGTLFPSPDHKAAYMAILAWLMRGGWVTQLRTFAFVRAGPEIKKAAREAEQAEKEASRNKDSDVGNGEEVENGSDRDITDYGDNDQTQAAQSHRPSLGTQPSSGDFRKQSVEEVNETFASLIKNPYRASPVESKQLEAIGKTLFTTIHAGLELSDNEKAELKKYWPVFTKYFNGKEPLEKIPVREGLKRKVVWDMLGRLGLFVHGVEDGDTGEALSTILVGVRHW